MRRLSEGDSYNLPLILIITTTQSIVIASMFRWEIVCYANMRKTAVPR